MSVDVDSFGIRNWAGLERDVPQNHRKTIGKPEETIGKPEENGGFPWDIMDGNLIHYLLERSTIAPCFIGQSTMTGPFSSYVNLPEGMSD